MRLWAWTGATKGATKNATKGATKGATKVSPTFIRPLFDRKRRHHAGRQMLGDVAVNHPASRVRHVGEQLHRFTGGDDRRVFPDEILARYTVAGQDEEPLAVQMNRVLHRVRRRRVVRDAELHHG